MGSFVHLRYEGAKAGGKAGLSLHTASECVCVLLARVCSCLPADYKSSLAAKR